MYYYDNILQQINNAVFVYYLNATLQLTHWIQLVPISVGRYLGISSY